MAIEQEKSFEVIAVARDNGQFYESDIPNGCGNLQVLLAFLIFWVINFNG